MLITTVTTRRYAVQQARANFAIEDFKPDADDRALQAGYVAGVVSLADMFQHARDFLASKKSLPNSKR